jgi:hypothetical protein
LTEYPRRRRLDPEPPKRGGIPIVPLVILVILGGLLLGKLLTQVFGAGAPVQTPSPRPSFTPLPEATATFAPTFTPTPIGTPQAATPTPAPSAAATEAPKSAASPKVNATPAVASSPSAAPGASPAVVKHVAKSTPPPVIFVTPGAGRPTLAPAAQASVAAAATPTPVLITGENSADHATAIVRAYVNALARGDSATATGYLASGLPSENFINPDVSVEITELHASASGSGYAVNAQIVTSKGTYLASFTLKNGPYGMQITDHSATHL